MKLVGATCFSGIGAPELAGNGLIDWVWSAEFEKTPSEILKARFPDSTNLGDVTAEDFIERAKSKGPIDLLVGGPPCQAFSFAGLRKSLGDDRGNLSLRFVEIAHAIRPRNLLVENVPGWLSTDDNAFGCFLGAIIGGDDPLRHPRGERWPDSGMVAGPMGRAAWRIFDAQHFGLAQRRRRVFVVVDFGNGADPARVLFERQGLQGNFAPSRGSGKDVAGTLSSRSSGGGGLGTDLELDEGLVASTGNLAHCLNAGGMGRQDYETETLIAHAIQERAVAENPEAGPQGKGFSEEIAFTLESRNTPQAVAHTLRGEGHDASEDGTGRGIPLVPIAFSSKDYGGDASENISPTLRAGNEVDGNPNGGVGPAIAWDLRGREGGAEFEGPHQSASIRSASGGSSRSYIQTQFAVRRLTPIECERLQGFPDGFTMIEGKTRRRVSSEMADYLRRFGAEIIECEDGSLKTRVLADGPRHKALGNSWAVPCGRWIIGRIKEGLS